MDIRLKAAVAASLQAAGVLRLLETLTRSQRRAIFTFHRVLPQAEMDECYNPYLAITPESFGGFLEYVRDFFTVLPLEEFVRFDRPAPACAITFDDGWEDNHRHAFPVLQRHRLPATIFLCTGLIGTEASIPEEALWRLHQSAAAAGRAAELLDALAKRLSVAPPAMDYNRAQQLFKRIPMQRKMDILREFEGRFGLRPRLRPSMMTWEQVREMAAAGVTFGSHTVRHAIVSVEDEAEARRELHDSRAELQARVPQEKYAFAYPNGGFNAAAMRLVEATGYFGACTTQVGFAASTSARQALPRFGVDNQVVNDARDGFSTARARLHLLRGGLFCSTEVPTYS